MCFCAVKDLLLKTRRIYRELGLQVRNKTPKRRVKAKLRDDRREATRPNETWAMDFVHDQLATGKKIRVLTVVDTFSLYVPVLDARFSYRGEDVVQTLERVCAKTAIPPRSGLIRDQSSSPATWICGLTPTASHSTSADQGRPPTTRSSKPSTDASGQNASTPTGS